MPLRAVAPLPRLLRSGGRHRTPAPSERKGEAPLPTGVEGGPLAEEEGRTAEEEQALLGDFLARVVRTAKGKVRRPPARQAKTTFRLNRPEGEAKCTVADGRLELRLQRDFSGVERKRLEAAVDAFLSALDGE